MTLSEEDRDTLEVLIDAHSLSAVLEAIADKCHAKADDKGCCGDAESQRQWLRAAARLDTLATVVAPL